MLGAHALGRAFDTGLDFGPMKEGKLGGTEVLRAIFYGYYDT